MITKRSMLGLSLCLIMGLCGMSAIGQTQAPDQHITINFEQIGHGNLIGDFYAQHGVSFQTFDDGDGIAWDVLQAGHAFQNPPSGNKAAHLSFGGPQPCGLDARTAPGALIFFNPPVRSIRFLYAACNEASLEAVSTTGRVLGRVLGDATESSQPFRQWRALAFEASDELIGRVFVSGIALMDDLQFSRSSTSNCPPHALQANFNEFPIHAGRFIWFNSAVKVSRLGAGPTTIMLDDGTIQFKANGTTYIVPVPKARITFSPTVSVATTEFDLESNTWITQVPSGISGDVFLAGVTFPVRSPLPAQIPLVTWKGRILTDTPEVTVQWKWAAAVYTQFSTFYPDLGVKPVDDAQASQYQNAHPAGSPENFIGQVTGGALGRGFTDYTGSYRISRPFTPCLLP